jgi:hypothetical protein
MNEYGVLARADRRAHLSDSNSDSNALLFMLLDPAIDADLR